MKKESHRNLIPFLPCMYMYLTRLGTPLRFFQFFGGEILPLTVMTYLVLKEGSWLSLFNVDFALFTMSSIFVYLVFFTLYEIGYIMNDCVAIKHEFVPTIRFDRPDEWKYLVFSKFLSFIFLTLLGSIYLSTDVCAIMGYSAVVIFLFMLHNILSIQERGLTYIWLQLMRLMILPYTVIHNVNILLAMLILIFPELFRRSVRYMRIKYLSHDRKFSAFDLKASLISVFLVGLIINRFAFQLFPALVLGYGIIITGIIISLRLKW